MSEFPVATSPSPGIMGVDWENRVDFERLRQYRLGRVRRMLEEFDGSLFASRARKRSSS